MGDTIDGSSGAAQGALEEDDKETGNFFQRLFSATRSHDTDENGSTPRQGSLSAPNLQNLQNMRLDDVLVPRADITAVAQDTNLADLVQVFKDSGYSRLPVYKDNLDNPVGLIHLKDLALKYGFNGADEPFSLKELLRPLIYAPPSMTIGVMMQKMQADRRHMALVIDEYGGVDGLLTIEDLVEQVLGEIVDEHDTEEDVLWVEEKPGVFLVQARASLSEFEPVLGVGALADADDEEIVSLGGLVFTLIGRIPAKGEIVPHPSGVEFEVVDADPRRIKRLRVTRNPVGV